MRSEQSARCVVFEEQLSDQMKRIFSVSKVTYSQPSETREQDCLFLDIEVAKSFAKNGTLVSKVRGVGTIFSNYEKIPFGHLNKRIQLADVADTKDLFFFDIDTNTKTYVNLVQRTFSFVYFFSGQYDPDNGTLTSITFPEVET